MRKRLLITVAVSCMMSCTSTQRSESNEGISETNEINETCEENESNSLKWEKIAIATADEIAIYQAPSDTAPKLVYDETKIEYFDVPLNYYGYWSPKSPKGSVFAINFSGPSFVVSEKEGWLEILSAGPKSESNGWVKARHCKTGIPTPITPDAIKQRRDCLLVDCGDEGTVGIYLFYDEMDSYAYFCVGHLVDGMIIASDGFNCRSASESEDHRPGIFKDGENYDLYFNSSMMTEGMPDLHKFTPEMIESIRKSSSPHESATIVYLYENNIYTTP